MAKGRSSASAARSSTPPRCCTRASAPRCAARCTRATTSSRRRRRSADRGDDRDAGDQQEPDLELRRHGRRRDHDPRRAAADEVVVALVLGIGGRPLHRVQPVKWGPRCSRGDHPPESAVPTHKPRQFSDWWLGDHARLALGLPGCAACRSTSSRAKARATSTASRSSGSTARRRSRPPTRASTAAPWQPTRWPTWRAASLPRCRARAARARRLNGLRRSTAMGEGLNAALLQRDHRHLVHSLHNGRRLAGNVWVRGEGTDLIDADGRRFVDAMSGLWNVTLGYGRRELGRCGREGRWPNSPTRRAMPGAPTCAPSRLGELLSDCVYPNVHRFFFTSGGGGSTDSTIKTALLLEGARPAGQVQDDQPARRLPRGHAGGDVRDRDAGLLAVVRAACPASCISPTTTATATSCRQAPTRHRRPPTSSSARSSPKGRSVALFIAEPVMGGGYVPPAGYFRRIRRSATATTCCSPPTR